MKIIATTGMPGSGKGEALRFLEKAGIPALVMRTVVQADMEKHGIEVNNKNLREYATSLRKRHGMDIIAKMCVPGVRKLAKKHELILIDGIRGYTEVKYFKKKFTKNFTLIAIHAPPRLRFERLRARGERWDMKSWKDFAWRDEKELGWGIGEAIAMADYVVDNSGNLKKMRGQLRKILKKINSQK